jgi:hypothetical protein
MERHLLVHSSGSIGHSYDGSEATGVTANQQEAPAERPPDPELTRGLVA